MKRPTDADFDAKLKGGAIEVRFTPADSYYLFARLADLDDIAQFGPVSREPSVRHARHGDLGDYSAHAGEVVAKARAAAIKYLEGKIFADASFPATLNSGIRATHCTTLQEAVLAWMRLPKGERDAATIRADNGTVYDADKIERLYHL
jgi:hypothetical protein